MSDETALFKDFLKGQYCLIVEPSASFSSSIQGSLSNLGIDPEQIIATRRHADARALIERHKPKLLITEYQFRGSVGLGSYRTTNKAFARALADFSGDHP